MVNKTEFFYALIKYELVISSVLEKTKPNGSNNLMINSNRYFYFYLKMVDEFNKKYGCHEKLR